MNPVGKMLNARIYYGLRHKLHYRGVLSVSKIFNRIEDRLERLLC